MSRKIGILGGTFNPVHRMHLKIADLAGTQFGLDEVWLMPSGDPPHKDKEQIAPGAERFRMVELAIAEYMEDAEQGHTMLLASDYELKRTGRIYTADTLNELTEEYPEIEWYFILGGDSILYLERWYNPEEILKRARLLVALRGGEQMEALETKRSELIGLFSGAQIDFIQIEADDLSSSRIRELLALKYRTDEDNKLLQTALPSAVRDYIHEKELYR